MMDFGLTELRGPTWLKLWTRSRLLVIGNWRSGHWLSESQVTERFRAEQIVFDEGADSIHSNPYFLFSLPIPFLLSSQQTNGEGPKKGTSAGNSLIHISFLSLYLFSLSFVKGKGPQWPREKRRWRKSDLHFRSAASHENWNPNPVYFLLALALIFGNRRIEVSCTWGCQENTPERTATRSWTSSRVWFMTVRTLHSSHSSFLANQHLPIAKMLQFARMSGECPWVGDERSPFREFSYLSLNLLWESLGVKFYF